MRKISLIFAILLLASLAACKPVSDAPVSAGGVAVIAHPWVRPHGTWVRVRGGWGWISAAATAATLGALAEGNLGPASSGTTSGSTGRVPYADTSQCKDPEFPGVTPVEKWLNINHRIRLDCNELRKLWRTNRFRRSRTQDMLRCITVILSRGSTASALSRSLYSSAEWVWNGGKVSAVRVSGATWRINGVRPAGGSWIKCARAEP